MSIHDTKLYCMFIIRFVFTAWLGLSYLKEVKINKRYLHN